MNIPKPTSKWTHENGNLYVVLIVTNEHAIDNDRYPVTVVYRSEPDGKIWSRPLSRWHGSMIEVDDRILP